MKFPVAVVMFCALLGCGLIGCEEELARETQVRERGDSLVVEETTVTREPDGAIRTDKEKTVIEQ